jgi:hypothetical protein
MELMNECVHFGLLGCNLIIIVSLLSLELILSMQFQKLIKKVNELNIAEFELNITEYELNSAEYELN